MRWFVGSAGNSGSEGPGLGGLTGHTALQMLGLHNYLRYPGNIVGHYRSFKMRALLPYRDELARDYMTLLDYELDVKQFKALPLTIQFYHNNQPHEYMPDLVVVRGSMTVLVHCTPFEHWQTEEERIGLGLATAWCMEHGCGLEVVAPSEIELGPYLRNVKLLSMFAYLAVHPQESEAIRQYLEDAGGPVPLRDLAREVGGHDFYYGSAVVLHQAYHHKVSLAIKEELVSPSTLVSLPEDGERQEQGRAAAQGA
ncbi:MAG: hypothetical protein M3441_04200 [Chloroflexota bacterium]|nr:hypothetical protein [Chloroflexota bacterium]